MIVDADGNVYTEPGTKTKTVIKEVVPDTTAIQLCNDKNSLVS